MNTTSAKSTAHITIIKVAKFINHVFVGTIEVVSHERAMGFVAGFIDGASHDGRTARAYVLPYEERAMRKAERKDECDKACAVSF